MIVYLIQRGWGFNYLEPIAVATTFKKAIELASQFEQNIVTKMDTDIILKPFIGHYDHWHNVDKEGKEHPD